MIPHILLKGLRCVVKNCRPVHRDSLPLNHLNFSIAFRNENVLFHAVTTAVDTSKILQDCYPHFVLGKIIVVVMVDSNPFYVLWKFHIL